MLILLSLFCTKSSNSCDFEAHLTVAKRLYLEDYKKYIEDYLMNKHPYGPSCFKGILSSEIFNILLLPGQFDLEDLKDALMTKEPRMVNPFDKTGREVNLMLWIFSFTSKKFKIIQFRLANEVGNAF